MYVKFTIIYEHVIIICTYMQSLGLSVSSDEAKTFLLGMTQQWVKSGASVAARFLPTNEVAGVIFTQIVSREEKEIFNDERIKEYPQNVSFFTGTV